MDGEVLHVGRHPAPRGLLVSRLDFVQNGWPYRHPISLLARCVRRAVGQPLGFDSLAEKALLLYKIAEGFARVSEDWRAPAAWVRTMEGM
eukprot:GDKH01001341.1.p1 GENE.GDKH01001341.1~~GDKH01001341.1.p1  ORF type:complete len:90 (+),score=9.42 GDKH01001341.1:130-399(+)